MSRRVSSALYSLGLDWTDIERFKANLLWAIRRATDDLVNHNDWSRP